MAQILVRGLEESVVKELKELAKKHNRSLEGEVRSILKDVAERQSRRRQAIREIERLHAELAGRPMTDSVELLHEARREWEEKWESS